MPSTIAATLDIREADDKPITQCIAEALAGKQMLLLIDNSEQVQAAARHISNILAACPSLKAIVTSREALRLSGARTIKVPPFELPDAGRLPPLAELKQIESVRLFTERAKAVREEFELTDENAADVVAICQRVDALPLGIELAASRVRAMQPARLLKALERRFNILTGGADDLLDHQKSLRELIAWSYDLLDDAERQLWRRLAVFVGGCTYEAAQTVCDPEDEFIVEIDVESLVDKSLVNLTLQAPQPGAAKLLNRPEDEEPRLTMLDTLREYALEQLHANGEGEALQQRYCEWCVDVAEQAEPELRGATQERWLRMLDREQNNFRGALETCLSEADSSLAPIALRLGAALWYFWYERGYLSEAHNWLVQALDATPGIRGRARAGAVTGLCTISRQQVHLRDAEIYAKQALELYTEAGDDHGVANILGQLGAIAVGQSDNERAADYLDRSLALLRNFDGDKDRLSFALVARGVIDHLGGDLDAAKAKYTEALDVGSELGNKDSIATALVNLGEIAEAEGQLDAAYTYYRDSLKLYGSLGFKVAIAYCMEVLAGMDCKHMDRPERAATLFGAADILRQEIDAPIEAFNADRLNQDIETTRTALGEHKFADAWQQGRNLGADAVIENLLT